MIRFLINVPVELHERLRALAKARGQTLNGLVRQVLWEWAERNAESN